MRAIGSILFATICVISTGCDRGSADELPVWSKSDHHNQNNQTASNSPASPPGSAAPSPHSNGAQPHGNGAQPHGNGASPHGGGTPPQARGNMPSLAEYGVTEVTLGAWKSQCMRCHGVIGRGDGPEGSMTGARDLTDPTWQRVAPDSEIKRAIQKGRGRMPAFSGLPEETVDGLVKLVRLLNRDPSARGGETKPAEPAPQP